MSPPPLLFFNGCPPSDQEMTEFIDRFAEMREKEAAEQRRTQETIVALLEHISEGMDREKKCVKDLKKSRRVVASTHRPCSVSAACPAASRRMK